MVRALRALYPAVLACAGIAGASELVRRDVQASDVTGFQSAILIANGRQTSCESVLFDSQAGVIAASCLTFTGGNGTIDSSIRYEVLAKTSSGAPTERYEVSRISVHPKYNPATFVNNLAVLQFSSKAKPTWQNYIGINPGEWNAQYFIRHSLANTGAMLWSDIIAYSGTDTPKYCAEASKAYSSNTGDFLCNYAGTLSIYNRKCRTPYGTVFGAIQPADLAMIAIHSHSAVYGTTMCSDVRKLHYYTLLRNYIGWAATVIGRPIGGFSKDAGYKFTPNKDYSMKAVSSTDVSGVTLFSGDRYARDPVDPALASRDTVLQPLTNNLLPSNLLLSNPHLSNPRLSSLRLSNLLLNSPAHRSPHLSNPLPSSRSLAPNLISVPTGAGGDPVNDPEINSQSLIPDMPGPTPTEHSTTTSNVVDIGSSNNTGGSESGTSNTNTNTSGGGNGGSSKSSSKTGIIVAVVVVVLLLIGGVAWVFFRRRRLARRRQNGWNRSSGVSLPPGMRVTNEFRGMGYANDFRATTATTTNNQDEIADYYSQRRSTRFEGNLPARW
ncbi:hypothetical protein H4R18_001003 [Coemansia javaensis]|uniref:Peptidase S1 domain-containing protein n=1 Tax=Coemansia javaensis TaxID=2761396 RepID=A0A9W8HJF8_9FUNG|nr:hypothetical protein H4R18_001003 [Coemansia javaensis]